MKKQLKRIIAFSLLLILSANMVGSVFAKGTEHIGEQTQGTADVKPTVIAD